jgi:hypothetical protein
MTTEAQIIEAATKLQAAGKKPTMEAIRQEIGGNRKPNTKLLRLRCPTILKLFSTNPP